MQHIKKCILSLFLFTAVSSLESMGGIECKLFLSCMLGNDPYNQVFLNKSDALKEKQAVDTARPIPKGMTIKSARKPTPKKEKTD